MVESIGFGLKVLGYVGKNIVKQPFHFLFPPSIHSLDPLLLAYVMGTFLHALV